mgnify:CR=1 FL=1
MANSQEKRPDTDAPAKKNVRFISLGCPKALVDSERILTQLKMDGYDIVPTYEGADVVECPLPAVLSVVKEINTPRLPSLKGKMRAKSFKPAVWNAAALRAEG